MNDGRIKNLEEFVVSLHTALLDLALAINDIEESNNVNFIVEDLHNAMNQFDKCPSND